MKLEEKIIQRIAETYLSDRSSKIQATVEIYKKTIMEQNCLHDGHPCSSYGSCGEEKQLSLIYCAKSIYLEEEEDRGAFPVEAGNYYEVAEREEWDEHSVHSNDNSHNCYITSCNLVESPKEWLMENLTEEHWREALKSVL